MSTPQLISMPTSACIGSAVIGLNYIVGRTESPFTFEDQSYKWQGERWEIRFDMPPFNNRAIFSDWASFALKLKGSFNRFLFTPPLGKNPRGIATGTPVVDGNNQTGNVLLTSGWTVSTNNILRKGDYFQVGTGMNSRLHMIVEDINSDSFGNATLSFEPALRYSPTDNSAITVNNPAGVFRMVSNVPTWSETPGPLYRISFDAVEVVNA